MNFSLEEATIASMQQAMEAGQTTSAALVCAYFDRIANLDKAGPQLNAVLEVNPDALFLAEAMDRERSLNKVRSRLHGIPIMIKDNIDTDDGMHTSAGSLALANEYAGRDAFLVRKLREAGAVILGKTNMTEFANFMTEGMPDGYSSRGGQVLNPYDADSRPGGSSSGSGVAAAANLCAVAIGTETSGSILCPASQCGVVGIKPTVGLISRHGIAPIAFSQDTAGPMARTVTDAAVVLGAMAGIDDNDPATFASMARCPADYTEYLDAKGLQGAKIGVPRAFYWDSLDEERRVLAERALADLSKAGAILVDPADIPSAGSIRSSSVLMYEFKASLNAYLMGRGNGSRMRTLRDIVDFNNLHPERTLKYGQKLLVHAEERTSGTLTEPDYIHDRLRDLRLCRTEGIDAVLDGYGLDAIVFPGDEGETIAARAGYPSVIVPAGFLKSGLPFGLTFTGRAFSEPVLLKLAYAYEQATLHRKAPCL
ncbi:amidase [Paenibacillus sp. MBLB4367]|uniref:amidase n=1 Tax=Paenibacillus sp. MBLB4367 TaxID=3384767 RepID=UPI003907F0D4